MERLKRFFANRYLILYLTALVGAAGFSWQS
jgi:hypothetical protein